MKVNSNYFKRRYTYGNKKKNYTLIVLFLTLFFTVGYAYLNTLLSINGTVKVNKNTWDVHFENIQKVDGSIDATVDATISNNTTVNFTVDLQTPGEFYSFTVDVVNSGTIDAMLSEILKAGLTTEQEVYTEYTVTYNDGEEILAKDSLPSNTKDTLLVTIKYKDDITAEQLPTEDQSINLSLEANYIQDDGTSDSRRPPKTLNDIVIMQNKENGRMVLDNQASNYVSASTGIMLYEPASDTNGKGVYVRNGTENNSYPIYYYRGAVENNNVIFAEFCWKIVRTTETGGVKLVYNGVPNNGTCNNTGEASQIGTSKFNSGTGYNSYVGYMYGTPNSATYEEEHKNTNESAVKKYIDSWYEANMTKYTSFLEDTIWCNDRTLYNKEHPGTGAGTSETYYGPYGRVMQYEGLSFECENQNDRFTVDEEMEGRVNGNGMLTYPIALLTADEVAIAGNGEHSYNNKNTYLVTGKTWWTMSPYAFLMWDELIPFVYALSSEDAWMYEGWLSVGVRPAISLKYGTLTNGMGDGSVDNPYVVDCEESEKVNQGNDDIAEDSSSTITGPPKT